MVASPSSHFPAGPLRHTGQGQQAPCPLWWILYMRGLLGLSNHWQLLSWGELSPQKTCLRPGPRYLWVHLQMSLAKVKWTEWTYLRKNNPVNRIRVEKHTGKVPLQAGLSASWVSSVPPPSSTPASAFQTYVGSSHEALNHWQPHGTKARAGRGDGGLGGCSYWDLDGTVLVENIFLLCLQKCLLMKRTPGNWVAAYKCSLPPASCRFGIQPASMDVDTWESKLVQRRWV